MKEAYYGLYKRIGLKISYYRKLRGLTQEQLAEDRQEHSFYRRGRSAKRQPHGFP